MKWGDLKFFLAVARSRSLTQAAAALGVNQSTVSRRLVTIENHLKTQLFDRTTHGPVLTEAGNELLPMAQRVEEEFFNIDSHVAGRDMRLSGRLRVTCIDMLIDRFLAPHLARFTAQHPDIEFEILTSFHPLDLMRREADVAIRASYGPPENLTGRRVFDFAMAVYGSRTLADGLPGNPDPAELNWVGLRDEETNRRTVNAQFPRAKLRHRADGLFMLNAFVREGIGVAVLPCYWTDRDPALRRIYTEPYVPGGLGLWVLIHPDMRRTARVRSFVDFITGVLIDDRERFEGRGVNIEADATS